VDKATLLEHKEKLKSGYKIVFEPIPHFDKLPSDVIAEIHIKTTEKVIKSQSFPSLQKCKEAWQVLIQQHLDAG
jgi:hypothetical protein